MFSSAKIMQPHHPFAVNLLMTVLDPRFCVWFGHVFVLIAVLGGTCSSFLGLEEKDYMLPAT